METEKNRDIKNHEQEEQQSKQEAYGLTNSVFASLKKDYFIIGKRRIKGWHAWLSIGVMIGIISGVALVADRTARFEASKAIIEEPVASNLKLSRGGRFNGEPTIAVNPLNPNNLIAAWMHSQKQKEIEIAVVSSGDGGATWTDPFLLGHVAPIYTLSADVSIAFDSDGTAHLTYIEMEPDPDIAPSCEFHMGSAEVVHRRSNDGGRTWSAPVRVRHSSDTPDFAIDRPWVAVDRSGGPFNGRVYVVSISFFCNNNPPQHVRLRWSMDQGATWSDDMQVDNAEYGTGPYPNMPFPAAIGVGGDGAVWIVYPSASRKACSGGFLSPCLLVAVSHDGGQTFSRSKVANVTSASRRGFLLFQTIAVDQVRGGRAFVFWPDGRFDSVGSDLLFVQSEDGGKSWSEPVRINDNPLGLGVGVDESWAAAADDGGIAVLWRDRRSAGSGSEVAFETYAAVSVDGGINFTPNVRFSDQPSPYSPVPCCNSFLGLTLGGGRLHAVWADFRENLWEIFYHSIGTTTTPATPTTPIFQYDVDGDGDVDLDDRNIVVAAIGTTPSGPDDPRDINKDGRINSLDVFLLMQQCTRPGCAVQSNE